MALLGLGRTNEAIQQLSEALTIFQPMHSWDNIMALVAESLLFLEWGKVERAVELYALAGSHPHVANSRWFTDVCGQPVARAAAIALLPEVAKGARQRGLALDWWATLAGLAEELRGLGQD